MSAHKPPHVLNAEEIEAVNDFVNEGWSALDVRREPQLAEVVLEYLRDLVFTTATLREVLSNIADQNRRPQWGPDDLRYAAKLALEGAKG